MSLWNRYRSYLRTPPEQTLSWNDTRTGARGWLVINSLRGGAAGGGTRMRAGLGPREVVYLAKGMELKFALSGPPIGGAKGGIDFDPHHAAKQEVLERWFRAIAPLLHERYGTAGDLNVDELADVIPCFERVGLRHPQEGIVRGHFRADGDLCERILRALDEGAEAPVPPPFGLADRTLTLADVATGYGVARALQRFYARSGRGIEGVRVLLEGFGNVGAACGLYLARAGARIVAIRDAEQALVEPAGLRADEVEDLICRSEDKLLPEDARLRRDDPEAAFWSQPADVFVCAALSGTITADTLGRLENAGVEVIASGANQPFRERSLGATSLQRAADRSFSIIPDVLASCGRARAFSYLMEPGARPEAEHALAAVGATVDEALDEALDRAHAKGGRRPTKLLAGTLALALDRIQAG